MDLLSTIRKTGSRGGANFSWDEVANSSHRENYLGHSLKAPVGRWQKGKDLNWYARAEAPANSNETDEERQAREKKEELRRIKEVEEDAIARTLGLPVPLRNSSGANAVEVTRQRDLGSMSGPKDRERHREHGHKGERLRRHDDLERRERRRQRSRSREGRGGRDGERRHRRRSHDERDSGQRTRSRDAHRRNRADERHDGRRHHSGRPRSRSRSPRERNNWRVGREENHGEGRRELTRDGLLDRDLSPRAGGRYDR